MTVLRTIKDTIKNILSPKAVVLMYHQVCKRESDPWQLAVSPENFDQQVEHLKQNFDVLPLDELVNAVRLKKLRHKTIAITLDDATIDNYFNARPRLKANDLPATFYSTTYAAQNPHSFWWEELETVILHSQSLPRELQLSIGGQNFSFRFEKDTVLTEPLKNEIRIWNADMTPCNERLQLFMMLWKACQPLNFREQKKLIEELKKWSGVGTSTLNSSNVMTVDQLCDLSRDPLFEVGAHTVHHAMLSRQEVEAQAYEIRESKVMLENWLNRSITGFAYPYGNYDSTTKILLRDAGFRYAVSTFNSPVTESSDLYELPRVQVKNWNGKEFESQLQKMLAS
jgi:peptidoglycan/xylan/chitin deacetylase (PgdA/CDA1 family)